MPRHRGRCPACKRVGRLTRHHLLPRRFYGNGQHNEHILLLCKECHEELEVRIPLNTRLNDWQYLAIAAKYLKEKSHEEAVSSMWQVWPRRQHAGVRTLVLLSGVQTQTWRAQPVRYHEWILAKLKEERAMKLNTCDHCGQKHLADVSVVVCRHTGKSTLQLLFCSEACANEHYINKLRSYEGQWDAPAVESSSTPESSPPSISTGSTIALRHAPMKTVAYPNTTHRRRSENRTNVGVTLHPAICGVFLSAVY